MSITIALTENQQKVLSKVDVVAVTGKTDGDTVYVGFNEITLKFKVNHETYQALNVGNKLYARSDVLVDEVTKPVRAETGVKSNPPLDSTRIPQATRSASY